MKIVVTGGAGFVGSHLVDRLALEGHEVVVVDHHKRDKLRFPNSEARVIKTHFGDPKIVDLFLAEKPDAVFHLAAQISVTHSVVDPVMDAQINIIDALQLLQAAKDAGTKKFIFASSGGAIYGDEDIVPTPELPNAQPISPYGVHKQTFEHYLQSMSRDSAISPIVLRFANIYGPRQQLSGGEGGVIPRFLEKILTNDTAIIFGDGSATRDYVFVDDAVDAFLLALQTDVPFPVNIATEKETSLLELWDLLARIHGEDVKKQHLPERKGEIMRSCLNASLGREILLWKPKTSLEQGLQQTYDWFKKTYYDASGNNGTN